MAELIWSEESLSDLEGIYDYIARNSLVYARYQVEGICKFTERLRQFPESGRHLPEFPNLPHREVIVDSYRYDSDSDKVKVVAVVHGRRLLRKTILT